jgi:hypothetical protein
MQSRNPFNAPLSVASPIVLQWVMFRQAAVEWIYVFCPEFSMSVGMEPALHLQMKRVPLSAV